jgi:hypothetical protein
MNYRRLLLPSLVAFLITPAWALDFTAQLKQLDGSAFVDPSGKEAPVTLGTIAEISLLTTYPDEQNLSGEEKTKRFSLALKIHEKKEVPLTADEITLIKKLIAKNYNALITGRAWELLDPASVPK